MIEFTKAFKASDGKAYATLEEAQKVEIVSLFGQDESRSGVTWEAGAMATLLIGNKQKIIDILTTTEKSRPKARAANGGKKTRKPKIVIASETAA